MLVLWRTARATVTRDRTGAVATMNGRRAAVFLDKRGTLAQDVFYNSDVDPIESVAGVLRGLQTLHDRGYVLIIISGQTGVAQRMFSETAFVTLVNLLGGMLARYGVPRHRCYRYLRHTPDRVWTYAINSVCRKPRPGLLLRAAIKCGVDLQKAWMIGDLLRDMEAGKRVGCRTILVHNGDQTEWHLRTTRLPDYIVSNLEQAARVIITRNAARRNLRSADSNALRAQRF
jgi:D-glycero-D-manno-heptose 1,7-bisphosphate phosphatase